jgi:arabinose-5-phosphate isomerase
MMKNKNILKIGKEVINLEINALKKLQNSIGKSFVQAVELIYNTLGKGNIILTGVGKSKLVLEKTCATFSSLGIPAYTLDCTAGAHGDIGKIQQKDIIIIASNSGKSAEFSPILKFAKTNNIKIIGITSNNQSQLYKNSSVKILHSKVKEAGFPILPTSSTALLAALGDAIAVAVAKKKKFTISSFGQFHPSGSIGKSLTKVEDLIILKSKLPYIKEKEKFSKILIKIASGKLGCTLVKKNNGIGLITNGDCMRARNKYKNFDKIKAKDIMTTKPSYVNCNVFVDKAIKIMNKKRINVLLVKKNNNFIGLVSLHSLLEFLENDQNF